MFSQGVCIWVSICSIDILSQYLNQYAINMAVDIWGSWVIIIIIIIIIIIGWLSTQMSMECWSGVNRGFDGLSI